MRFVMVVIFGLALARFVRFLATLNPAHKNFKTCVSSDIIQVTNYPTSDTMFASTIKHTES